MAIFADKRNGKLTGRFRVELQINGMRVRGRFNTLEEAKNYEAKTRLDMARGKMPTEAKARLSDGPKVETLGDLQRAVEGHLWAGDSTERQAHQRLEGAFRIMGPTRLIESITVEDIDNLVRVLRSKQSAPGTINRYVSAVNTALKWALKRGHRVSPLPELEWQSEDEGRVRWITPQEEQRLLELLPRAEACAVYVSIRTGMRRGELLNLMPRDVEAAWVHLWGKGTKSGKSRSIPLTPDVYLALQEYLSLGKVSIESLRHHWQVAKKAMGLEDDEDFVFHCCRHTFATRAVQSGVHPRVLQRLMGHADLATTMRYMQVSDHMLTHAIDQIRQAQNPIGSISYPILWGSDVGALQGGINPLIPPIDTARKTDKTLRQQGVKEDLGSSGVTRGGSSPSARTR